MDIDLGGLACLLFPIFLVALFIVALVFNRRAAKARDAPKGGDPEQIAAEQGWRFDGPSGRVLFGFANDDWIIEARKPRHVPGQQHAAGPTTTWSTELPNAGKPVVIGPQPPSAIRSLDPEGSKTVKLLRGLLSAERDPINEVVAVKTGHAILDDRYLTAALAEEDAKKRLLPAADAIAAWSGPALRLFHVDDQLRLQIDGAIADADTLKKLIELGSLISSKVD